MYSDELLPALHFCTRITRNNPLLGAFQSDWGLDLFTFPLPIPSQKVRPPGGVFCTSFLCFLGNFVFSAPTSHLVFRSRELISSKRSVMNFQTRNRLGAYPERTFAQTFLIVASRKLPELAHGHFELRNFGNPNRPEEDYVATCRHLRPGRWVAALQCHTILMFPVGSRILTRPGRPPAQRSPAISACRNSGSFFNPCVLKLFWRSYKDNRSMPTKNFSAAVDNFSGLVE
jgi:hypothetical protein